METKKTLNLLDLPIIGQEKLEATTMIKGLVSPTCLTQDTYGNLYVSDQIGIIYIINPETFEKQEWLSIKDKVVPLKENYDESGLLSFAFHPFRSSIYLFYTQHDGKSDLLEEVVFKYGEVESDLLQGMVSKYGGFIFKELKINILRRHPILTIPKNNNFHHGGRLAFQPSTNTFMKSYLYLSIGDDGPQKDPLNHGQDLSVLYGKILRLDVEKEGEYSIPRGRGPRDPLENPFLRWKDVRPEIYAYGFRNPWSLNFDDEGKLWVGDPGDKDMEEVDLVKRGGNYGWSIKEGTFYLFKDNDDLTSFHQRMDKLERSSLDLIDPIFEYQHLQVTTILGSQTKSIAITSILPLSSKEWVITDISGLTFHLIRDDSNDIKLINLFKYPQMIKSASYIKGKGIFFLVGDKIGPSGNNGQVVKISFN